MSKSLEEQFFQRLQMKGKQVHEKKMLTTLVNRKMQIKPQGDITSCPLEWPSSITTSDNKRWWGYGEKELFYTVVGL